VRGTARIYASVVTAAAIGLLTAACSSGPPQTPAQASASAGRRVRRGGGLGVRGG
jgi:hypothetical protein